MPDRRKPRMTRIDLKWFPKGSWLHEPEGFVSMTTSGESIEFELVGRHWHNILKSAVKALHSKAKHRRMYWGSIGASYVGFPIVYNYRHVVELYLKGMLITGEPALLLAGEPGIKEGTFRAHSFSGLFPEVERVFKVLHVPWNLGVPGFKTKQDLRRLLTDLDHMEIRYPITTKREPSLGDTFMCFNLFQFASLMDDVLHALDRFVGGIAEEVDARCEAWAEEAIYEG